MEKYALDNTKVIKQSGMILLPPYEFALIEILNSLNDSINKISRIRKW